MSIIKHVTLQKIVAHDFRYDPRIILIAFVRQQLLSERVSQLSYTYSAYLVMVTASVKRLTACARSFSCFSSLHASPNNFKVMKPKKTRQAVRLAGLGGSEKFIDKF